VPFCVQWKGKLPAGKTYEHPVIQLDIVPTCLAAAGASVERDWKLDGVNLLPYLTGDDASRPHETLYWRFGQQWAIRHGDWKLMVGNGGGMEPELYNLAADLGESKNLAAQHPDKAQELRALWEKWNAEQAPPSAPREQPAKAKATKAKAGKGKKKKTADATKS
jgi:arylsulfatase A-like enzyme